MLSGWIGVCGCIAWDAVLDSASVPADIGLPAWEPALKFCEKPSGESAFVGAEVEGSEDGVGAEPPVDPSGADTPGLGAVTDPPGTPIGFEAGEAPMFGDEPARGVVPLAETT
jgi:hypothetical protein